MVAAASLALARAVEQCFAALLGFEAWQRERLVEVDRGLSWLVGRDPEIAGRCEHARGLRVFLRRCLGRFLEALRRALIVAPFLRLECAADERVGGDDVGAACLRRRCRGSRSGNGGDKEERDQERGS